MSETTTEIIHPYDLTARHVGAYVAFSGSVFDPTQRRGVPTSWEGFIRSINAYRFWGMAFGPAETVDLPILHVRLELSATDYHVEGEGVFTCWPHNEVVILRAPRSAKRLHEKVDGHSDFGKAAHAALGTWA